MGTTMWAKLTDPEVRCRGEMQLRCLDALPPFVRIQPTPDVAPFFTVRTACLAPAPLRTTSYPICWQVRSTSSQLLVLVVSL